MKKWYKLEPMKSYPTEGHPRGSTHQEWLLFAERRSWRKGKEERGWRLRDFIELQPSKTNKTIIL